MFFILRLVSPGGPKWMGLNQNTSQIIKVLQRMIILTIYLVVPFASIAHYLSFVVISVDEANLFRAWIIMYPIAGLI